MMKRRGEPRRLSFEPILYPILLQYTPLKLLQVKIRAACLLSPYSTPFSCNIPL